MRVRLDCGKVQIEDGEGWNTEWRDAHPHETIPALMEIVSDLQRRIHELERWRDRLSNA